MFNKIIKHYSVVIMVALICFIETVHFKVTSMHNILLAIVVFIQQGQIYFYGN